jgi:hypothetical protein
MRLVLELNLSRRLEMALLAAPQDVNAPEVSVELPQEDVLSLLQAAELALGAASANEQVETKE